MWGGIAAAVVGLGLVLVVSLGGNEESAKSDAEAISLGGNEAPVEAAEAVPSPSGKGARAEAAKGVMSLGGQGVRVASDEDVVTWVMERQAQAQAAGNTWLHEKLVRQTDNMTQELSGMESITHRSGIYRAACSFDEVAIVRYLVEEKGVKMTADYLEEAAESCAYEVCRYIIEGKLLPANELQEALSDALHEAVECDAKLAGYLMDCGATLTANKAARRLARVCGMDAERRQDVYSRNQGRGIGPQTDEEMCNELKACARVLVERLRVPVTQQYVERATQRGLPELAEYLTSHM